jgi:hypothetical protein
MCSLYRSRTWYIASRSSVAHCQPALPVSVGLLLGMTGTCCHVLQVPEYNLAQGITFVSVHTVHLPYK